MKNMIKIKPFLEILEFSALIYILVVYFIFSLFSMTDILRPGAEFTPDFHLPGSDSVGDETNRFMQRVYSWMTLALVISCGYSRSDFLSHLCS
jgi:hypothetical protein